MFNRILQLFPEGTSHTEMCRRTGISTQIFGHVSTGRNKISLEFINKVHAAFPNVSLNWLMYGEGEKYIDGTVKNTPNNEKAKELIKSLREQNLKLANQIEELSHLI